jgi:hypothetical protein
VAERKEAPALTPMMSLAGTARLAYHAITGGHGPDERTLNDIARLIATRVGVFECQSPEAEPVRVTHEDIFSGRFLRGGAELTFADGRPSRSSLCIRVTDLNHALVEMRAAYPGKPLGPW